MDRAPTRGGRARAAAYVNREPPGGVSVVVPTRDRPEMLIRALSSVLGQTTRVDEIIVVDDASATSAQSALASLQDSRLRILRHPRVRGASAARNTGLAAAGGRYIAFLDDDDSWSPTKIERQLEVFDSGEPGIAGVFTYSRKLSPQDPEWSLIARTPSLQLGFEDFLRKTYFGASVPLLRADCLRRVGGFDESLVSVQDRDLWLRIARRHEFAGVPEVLVQHYIHGAQITTDLDRKIAGREQLLEKYEAELSARPTILAIYCWRLGLLCCARGDQERGQRWLRRARDTDGSLIGPAQDLDWSRRAPAEHARHLVEERFERVGDIVLYY